MAGVKTQLYEVVTLYSKIWDIFKTTFYSN
jgi:hypothetical protein